MREVTETVVPLNLDCESSVLLDKIEEEIFEFWDKGWSLVKAEPDKLMESVRLYFEKPVETL